MVCWWRSDGGEDSAPRRRVATRSGATSTTLAATRRHRCRPGMAAADCAGFARAPKSVVAPAALNDHQNLAALIIFSGVSHARGGGTPMMALAARCELGGGERQHPVSTTCVEGLLWHRSLCRGRARGQRRACEIDLRAYSTCASSCGALCGNGRSPAADVDGLLVAIGRRRGSAPAGDAATAQQRATSTTLAATRRHRCRPGMVAADCAGFARAPKSVVAPAALNDHQKFGLVHLSLSPLARARR